MCAAFDYLETWFDYCQELSTWFDAIVSADNSIYDFSIATLAKLSFCHLLTAIIITLLAIRIFSCVKSTNFIYWWHKITQESKNKLNLAHGKGKSLLKIQFIFSDFCVNCVKIFYWKFLHVFASCGDIKSQVSTF